MGVDKDDQITLLNTIDFLTDYNSKQNNLEKAIELITKAVELSDDNPHYYIMRCGLYYNIGKYKEAKDDIEKSKSLKPTGSDKKNCELYLKKLSELNSKKDSEKKTINEAEEYSIKSEEEFADKIAQFPDNARLYFARAKYRLTLKKYDEIEQDVNKAIDLKIPSEDKEQVALVLDFLADYNSKQNNPEKAIELVTKAIDLLPDNSHYYVMRCGLYYNNGRYEEAENDIKIALSKGVDKDEKRTLINIIDFLADYNSKQNNPEKAIELVTKAIEISPNNAHYYLMKGGIHFNLKQYKEAKKELDKAMTLSPSPEDKKSCDVYLKEITKVI